MKKLLAITAALTLVLALSTTAAATVEPLPHSCNGCAFVDTDGNGVCDNASSHHHAFVDTDGNGVCDNAKRQRGCYRVEQSSDERSGSRQGKGHHGGGHRGGHSRNH